ncbi:MAG: PocR ligand-binding domain-containing protein [Oscillospiraceae bacterium]|nr:PocR ligand-binding domain-containing protein [Oscillospiraceae bacterium]
MISVFNLKEMEHLLEDFYRITRIRITVFDEKFQEILSVPESRPRFCQLIRSCEDGRRACARCDAQACAYAAGQNKTHIYRCHGGLTEAIMPLYVGKVLVGYLLFGHVFAYGSLEAGWSAIESACKNYPIAPAKLKSALQDMPLISYEYIRSAARILHMTASFLVMERMATLQEDTVAARLDAYLREHFTDSITADALCDALQVGRSKLFKLSRDLYGCGIQQQVRNLRMEKAKQLLLDRANLSIMDIATECGYRDYNYFISVFSKYYGMAPNRYRQQA